MAVYPKASDWSVAAPKLDPSLRIPMTETVVKGHPVSVPTAKMEDPSWFAKTESWPIVERGTTSGGGYKAPVEALFDPETIAALDKPIGGAALMGATMGAGGGVLGTIGRYGMPLLAGAALSSVFGGETMDWIDVLAPGVPGRDVQLANILPGGAPAISPDLPRAGIAKKWWTGTTWFAIDDLGKYWVLTKKGWKTYRPRRPIVIGKAATPKNRRKIIRALKRFNKTATVITTGKTGKVRK